MGKSDLILLMLVVSSCNPKIPQLHTELWDPEPALGAIVHKKECKDGVCPTISCDDVAIKDFVCMTVEDLQEIVSTMLKCKDWGKTELMPESQKRDMAKELSRLNARSGITFNH